MRRLLLPCVLLLSACSADVLPGPDEPAGVPFAETGVMVNSDNEWHLEYEEDGATVSKILSMTSRTLCTVRGVPEPCISVTPAQGQRVSVQGTMQSADSRVVRADAVVLE